MMNFEENVEDILRQITSNPFIIMMCGVTGSGKTTAAAIPNKKRSPVHCHGLLTKAWGINTIPARSGSGKKNLKKH
ncbi:hypothetical protein MUB24_13550 [Lederbergia sp. NSJ-179]|uniref:hypothetical protein n=1 Tax=Lederbergia sp. NSJ-179 TaxID=2931402 RepID=UPI001FD341DD|nr:hypothetical protein [Lederbergia sp. NSJ-179]MCJ7841905.1 hypothetical protein [Lederbergia sp. NSJ-179]